MEINRKEIKLFILIFIIFLLIDSPFSFGKYLFFFVIIYFIRLYSKKTIVLNNISFFFRNKLLIISCLTLIIGIVRNCVPNIELSELFFKIIKFVSFIFFVTFFIRSYIIQNFESQNKIRNLVLILITPFFIIATLNLILFLLFNIKNESTFVKGNSVTLHFFGLDVNRVKFYFVAGINSYGATIGIFLSVMLAYYFMIKKHSIALVGLFVFLLILFFTDTRGAIIFSLLAFFLVFLINKKVINIKFSKWLTFLMIAGPFLLLLALSYFGKDFLLTREGEDIQSGNSRLIIWAISLIDLAEFKWIHLIGYGEYGIRDSASFYEFSNLWKTDDIYLLHPHNALLVSITDNGYIGAIVFILLTFLTIKKMEIVWKYFKDFQILLLVAFIYIILIGLTETTYGFYYPNFYCIFYMFVILQTSIFDYIKHYKVVE